MIDHAKPAPKSLARLFLLACALCLLPTFLHADGSGGLANDGNPANASNPTDEVTSLPIVIDPTGLTLVGKVRDLRQLVRSVQGSGVVIVRRLGEGSVAVTWMGDYRLVLDRAELALGRVNVLFVGGRMLEGGVVMLSIAGREPLLLPAERIPLPATRLAESMLDGVGLRLVARSELGDRGVSGGMVFGGATAVWAQRLH